ncbi:MAG: hypothetical protein S4CHLAM7_05710 [Chlamydiae bacterium]|nr:hypothetical protein [Chlamydiota bacterium]
MMQKHEKFLEQILQGEKIPQALLFIGSNREKMLDCAKLFAQKVLQMQGASEEGLEKMLSGNHPDFSLLTPSSKSGVYTIEQIRGLSSQSQLYPHESPSQFFVLKGAERMQEAAANALLKTIEEPVKSSYFILMVGSLDALLPTLVSRFQKVIFQKEELVESEKKHQVMLSQFLESWPKFSYHELNKTCSSILDSLEKEIFSKKEKSFEEQMQFDEEAKNLFLQVEKWFLSLQQTLPLSYKQFQKSLEKTRLGFERSIKLSICLENILINFV